MPKDTITFLSIRDVSKRTRLAKSTIYAKVACGEFPAPVRVSQRASAWVESEIEQWARSKIAESRGSAELAIEPNWGQ